METVRARRIGNSPLDLGLSVKIPAHLETQSVLACRTEDPELFFPENYGLAYRHQIKTARQICAACPVREMCLEWAASQTDLEGIWAGTTPPQRRRLRTGKTLASEQSSAA